jgi:hypothetical protein
MRAAHQFEWTMAWRMFPFLNDVDTAERTPAEWIRLLARTKIEYSLRVEGEQPGLANVARTGVLVMRSYPIAKRALIAAGYDASRIEKMPAGQVVAIYTRDCHRYVADQCTKWLWVPYPISIRETRATLERMRQEGYLGKGGDAVPDRDPLLLNTEILFGEQIVEANSRQPRTIAVLLAVEAIRMHAAANEGKLPASLADIKLVPIPLSPATNTPILYRVVDGRAELLIPPTRPGDPYTGRRVLMRMR